MAWLLGNVVQELLEGVYELALSNSLPAERMAAEVKKGIGQN